MGESIMAMVFAWVAALVLSLASLAATVWIVVVILRWMGVL